MLSVNEINLLQAQNEGLKKQNADLQKENAKLKEKIKEKESEIRQKRMTILMNNDHYLTVDEKNRNYKQTLQEIKAIATECTTCGDCSNCKYNEDCDTDIEEQALGVCRMILNLIIKAESEDNQ